MLKTLEIAFVEMDAEVLVRQTEWAMGRMKALREFKASDEYQTLRRDQRKLYDRLFNIAGGKGWYNLFNGRNETMVREEVAKNCKRVAEKRNATIITKLNKIGVTEIGPLEYNHTHDGFNGVFVFNGVRIEIRTIIAGVYNVQCLHKQASVHADGKRA